MEGPRDFSLVREKIRDRPSYSSFLCYAVHLDPPNSPFPRGTFFVPPLGRGARGDLTYLIISKSAVCKFLSRMGES
jgi:hypothetical protein